MSYICPDCGKSSPFLTETCPECGFPLMSIYSDEEIYDNQNVSKNTENNKNRFLCAGYILKFSSNLTDEYRLLHGKYQTLAITAYEKINRLFNDDSSNLSNVLYEGNISIDTALKELCKDLYKYGIYTTPEGIRKENKYTSYSFEYGDKLRDMKYELSDRVNSFKYSYNETNQSIGAVRMDFCRPIYSMIMNAFKYLIDKLNTLGKNYSYYYNEEIIKQYRSAIEFETDEDKFREIAVNSFLNCPGDPDIWIGLRSFLLDSESKEVVELLKYWHLENAPYFKEYISSSSLTIDFDELFEKYYDEMNNPTDFFEYYRFVRRVIWEYSYSKKHYVYGLDDIPSNKNGQTIKNFINIFLDIQKTPIRVYSDSRLNDWPLDNCTSDEFFDAYLSSYSLFPCFEDEEMVYNRQDSIYWDHILKKYQIHDQEDIIVFRPAGMAKSDALGFVLTNYRFIILDSKCSYPLSRIDNTMIEISSFGCKYFIIAFNSKIKVSVGGMTEAQLRFFDSFLKAYINRFIVKNNEVTNKSTPNEIKTIKSPSGVAKSNSVNNTGSKNTISPIIWKCKCGKENNNNFCTECGQPKPISNTWVCTKCGNKNDNNFCTECGQSKPASSTWICTKCGKENDSNFCTECGNKRNA